jgi:proline iminopeptidase
MPFTEVRGAELYFETRGSGPPCLTLHGGLGFDHHYMKSLAPIEDSVQVTYFDQRGNGQSSPEFARALTMENLADDAAALMAQVSPQPWIVLGHSFGGFVAQELALRHPAAVRALVLIDTTPGQLGANETPSEEQGPPPPPGMAELMSRPPDSDSELEEMAEKMLSFYLHNRPPSEVLPLFSGTIYSAQAMIRGFEVLSGWSSVDRLSTISCPTLLLWGREDVVCSYPQAKRIASRMADATLEVFNESGHFPWLEAPEHFFLKLRGWLGARGFLF